MVLGIGVEGFYDVVFLRAANFASMRHIEWSRVEYYEIFGLIAPKPFGLGIEGITYGDEKKEYGISIYEYTHALAAPTPIYVVAMPRIIKIPFGLRITTEYGQLPIICYLLSRGYALYTGWEDAEGEEGQVLKNIVVPTNSYIQNPCITYERGGEFSYIKTQYTIVPTQMSTLI